jgi:hypothetical protein
MNFFFGVLSHKWMDEKKIIHLIFLLSQLELIRKAKGKIG